MATYTDLNEEKFTDLQDTSGMTVSDHLNRYNAALDRLTQVRNNLPTYEKSYDNALQELFDHLSNYESFQYDTRGDALYQAYKQSYMDAGRTAMQDAMGQAAALTGGYGSTYGQSVGQQQYSTYLQKLNDMLPETYGMAYRQYQDGRDALQTQYNMTQQLADEEYQQYQDRLSAYYQELGYWQDIADTAYNRYQKAEEQAYDRQQDAYDRLAEMIVTMGYVPNEADLAAAGMTQQHYQTYLNYYNSLIAEATSSGGGGSGRSKKKKTEESVSLYDQILAEQKELIDQGTSVESINGALSRNVGNTGLSVDETRKIMVELQGYAGAKNK